MMSSTAIDPRSISRVRGLFRRNRRSFIEWIFPLAMIGAPTAVPVAIYFFSPPQSPPMIINVMLFALLPAVTLLGLYMLTTSYEFDGKAITCRRLGFHIAWQHPVSDIEAVQIGPEVVAASLGALNYFRIRWPDGKRSLVLTSDLRHALRQCHNNI